MRTALRSLLLALFCLTTLAGVPVAADTAPTPNVVVVHFFASW